MSLANQENGQRPPFGTHVAQELSAEPAAVVLRQPLDMYPTEDHLGTPGVGAAVLEVLDLVLAADLVGPDALHGLAEVGHALLGGRELGELVGRLAAFADERLQGRFASFKGGGDFGGVAGP